MCRPPADGFLGGCSQHLDRALGWTRTTQVQCRAAHGSSTSSEVPCNNTGRANVLVYIDGDSVDLSLRAGGRSDYITLLSLCTKQGYAAGGGAIPSATFDCCRESAVPLPNELRDTSTK